VVYFIYIILLTFIFPMPLPAPAEARQGAVEAGGSEALPAEIRAIMDAPLYRYARWGVCVVDLADGRTLYAVRADELFRTASLTKLFSAAAALDGLGRDHVVKTSVHRRGELGKDGRLQGDLVLVAGGDPWLSDLGRLARSVRASGIRAVQGDVLVDDRAFEPFRVYSVSRPGLLLHVVSPATLQGNTIEIVLKPTRPGAPAALDWRPRAPWVSVQARVRTVSAGQPERIETAWDGAGRLTVSGRIPPGGEVTRRVPVEDPVSLMRSLFIVSLKEAGVRVAASARRSHLPGRLPDPGRYGKDLPLVAEAASPPLKTYLQTVLKSSHNPGADALPLLLAAKEGTRTVEGGMGAIRRFLTKTGVDLRSISLGDGSGIATTNLATPRTVVQFLQAMTAHRDYDVFFGGLPVFGVDGTLASAADGKSPARGKIWAKTGTIGLFDLLNDSGFVSVKALAGYMTAASGRSLAFALIVNDVHVRDAPDRTAVLRLTNTVGADLNRVAEALFMQY